MGCVVVKDFVQKLKGRILEEFSRQDRNGVCAFTQTCMAFNSNKIEGSLRDMQTVFRI